MRSSTLSGCGRVFLYIEGELGRAETCIFQLIIYKEVDCEFFSALVIFQVISGIAQSS
jgi:hypothetical protein